MLDLLMIIVFCWLFFKALGLVFRLAWGVPSGLGCHQDPGGPAGDGSRRDPGGRRPVRRRPGAAAPHRPGGNRPGSAEGRCLTKQN